MAIKPIKIQTQELYIPVEIGTVELKFPIDDESLLKLHSSWQKVADEIKRGEKDEKATIESHESQKKAVKKAYDFMFGDGSFEKVYEVVPSTRLLIHYFVEIGMGIKKELESQDKALNVKHQKTNAYLKDKKK